MVGPDRPRISSRKTAPGVVEHDEREVRGQLLNGALRRVQAVASSARVTPRGLKDTFSRIWITRFVQTGTCNEARGTVQCILHPDIRFIVFKYVLRALTHDRN